MVLPFVPFVATDFFTTIYMATNREIDGQRGPKRWPKPVHLPYTKRDLFGVSKSRRLIAYAYTYYFAQRSSIWAAVGDAYALAV